MVTAPLADVLRRRTDDAVVLVPAGLALAVFLAWTAHLGGYPTTTWLPGALFFVGLLAALAVAGPAVLRMPSRLEGVALAALTALTAWSFLSIAWADVKGDAWDGANRTLLFLTVYALFASLRWRAGTAALFLGAFVLGVTLVGVWAVTDALRSADPLLFVDGRFAHPTGYANANAALFLLAFWPAVVLGARRELHPLVRAPMLAAAAFLLQTALLPQSRGAAFGFPIMAVLLLAVAPQRIRTAASLAIPVAALALAADPILAVYDTAEKAGFAEALDAVGPRMILATALAGVAALLWALGDRLLHLSHRTERMLAISGAVATALVALGLVTLVLPGLDPVDRVERGWEQFIHNETAEAGSTHFTAGLGSNRYDFWRVGLERFREEPLTGIGVDNFAVDYLRLGRSNEQPQYPHSVEIRALVQLGVVGAAFLAIFVAAGVAAALLPRGRDRFTRATTVAALSIFGWWFVQGSADWFWEFAGLGAPAFAALGLAGALGRTPPSTTAPPEELVAQSHKVDPVPSAWRRRILAGAGGGLVIAAAFSYTLPWLAARHVAAAQESWRADTNGAFRSLARAADLNRLSDEPSTVAGVIAAKLDDRDRSAAAFRETLARNPQNWYAELELGLLASQRGDRAEAVSRVRRALRLNPREPILADVLARVRKGEHIAPRSLDKLFLSDIESLQTRS
jgi:tetratricopeptide (TPR) repeat protein